MYIKYRFFIKNGHHPINFNNNFPYWITKRYKNGGFSIVVILKENENIYSFWPYAVIDKSYTKKLTKITYTDRFSKPLWIKN